MKSKSLLVAGLLLASLSLAACQSNSQSTSSSSSSKQTTVKKSSSSAKKSNTSEKKEDTSAQTQSSASSQTSVAADAKEGSSQASTGSMSVSQLAAGDFSSMVGTWQDAQGHTYDFDVNGLVSPFQRLELEQAFVDESGIYRAGFRHINGPGAAILFIPAGVSLPAVETTQGSDPTDTSKDRFIIAQGISENPDVYYKVKQGREGDSSRTG